MIADRVRSEHWQLVPPVPDLDREDTRSMSSDRAAWWKRVNESPPLCLAYVKEHAERGNAQSVVDAIDAFAMQNAMINVGREKGEVVDAEIRAVKPHVFAELGAFSGYSTVRFASVQREVSGPNSHYYSFEFSPEFADIVREMVAFAGLEDQVTVITGAFADQYQALEGKLVDFFFIDHEKDCYLPDTRLVLDKKLLHAGSVLAIDNMIVPGAPEVAEFIESHPQFESRTVTVEANHGDRVLQDAVLLASFKGGCRARLITECVCHCHS